ncbi:MAG: S-methyl-5'-thioadenosine phosphorylase [Candidatus Omnitrophota bacterium]
MAKIGIIGGSGLYEMEDLNVLEERPLATPFGSPSGNFMIARYNEIDVVFLARHGKGHRISPSRINYRANIFGMKKLGVDAIVSVSACGSLKEELKPLDFVLPDQFIDRTFKRETSFFTEGLAVHAAFGEPTAPELRAVLADSARELGLGIHGSGTYVNMEGPQFSTKAESNLYRAWGADVIGMTTATEAKLAREAEISYATLAAVTDYDCWHETHESVSVEMIIKTLKKNVVNAQQILKLAIPRIAAMTEFSARDALRYAIITPPDMISEDKKRELEPLIGKYIK